MCIGTLLDPGSRGSKMGFAVSEVIPDLNKRAIPRNVIIRGLKNTADDPYPSMFVSIDEVKKLRDFLNMLIFEDYQKKESILDA